MKNETNLLGGCRAHRQAGIISVFRRHRGHQATAYRNLEIKSSGALSGNSLSGPRRCATLRFGILGVVTGTPHRNARRAEEEWVAVDLVEIGLKAKRKCQLRMRDLRRDFGDMEHGLDPILSLDRRTDQDARVNVLAQPGVFAVFRANDISLVRSGITHDSGVWQCLCCRTAAMRPAAVC